MVNPMAREVYLRKRLPAEELGEFIALYESGASLSEIGVRYSVKAYTVRYYLKKQGVAFRQGGVRKGVPSPLRVVDPVLAYNLYSKGLTLEEVSSHFGVTREAVRLSIVKSGKSTRGRGPGGVNWKDLNVESLVKDYLAGDNLETLATKNNVTAGTVKSRLETAGVVLRGRSRYIDEKFLIESYSNGLSIKNIADVLAIDERTVSNRLKELGVAVRPKGFQKKPTEGKES